MAKDGTPLGELIKSKNKAVHSALLSSPTSDFPKNVVFKMTGQRIDPDIKTTEEMTKYLKDTVIKTHFEGLRKKDQFGHWEDYRRYIINHLIEMGPDEGSILVQSDDANTGGLIVLANNYTFFDVKEDKETCVIKFSFTNHREMCDWWGSSYYEDDEEEGEPDEEW
jgi:hypothetical protein